MGRLWMRYEALARRRGFVLLVLAACVLASLGWAVVRRPWQELPRTTWTCGFESGRTARLLLSGRGFGSPFALLPGDRFWVRPPVTDGLPPPPAQRLTVAPGEPVPPTAWVTPPGVALWALVFTLFGVYTPAAWAAYLVLQVVGMAAAVFLLWRSLELTAGSRAAAAGLFLLALYPPVWFAATDDTHTTVLFVLLLAAGLYALGRAVRGGGTGWIALHSSAFALAALTEPSSIVFLAGFEGWLAWRGPLRTRRPRWLLATALACALVWGPWAARNWADLGEPLLFKSNLPVELWYGNNSDALDRGFLFAHERRFAAGNEVERRRLLSLGEPAYARECLRQAMDFVRSNPGGFLVLTARRVLYFWTWQPGKPNPARPYLAALFLAVLGSLAVLRLRAGRTADRSWLEIAADGCLLLYPLAYYATHFMLYRYRLPLELMLLLALACAAARRLPEPAPAASAD